jgi:subtilisin family serine protease
MRAAGRAGSATIGVALMLALGLETAASAAQHAPARYAPGPAAPSLTGLVRAMGASAADAADRRYAYLRKLDSHLQRLEAARLDGGDLASVARREALALSDDERRVLVDVYVTGDMAAATSALRARGMDVRAISDRRPQRMVEGTLAPGALTDVAGLAGTRAVLAVQGSQTNEGSVLSQGDAAHRGPQARAFGPTGAGVPVGIISNSINRAAGGVAGSQASGNLPGPASSPPGQVQVLADGTAGSSDEGRAMAEIVFDTAPGIRNMLFATGTGGAATRASAIDGLVAAGAKVIADDVFQITEPFFQDGIVAQAVDRAKAAGVTYLVSAGNRARQSWEGTYGAMADPRGVSPSTNDFDPAAPADAVQTIGTFTDRNMFVELQWDEPFGQASTDLAIDVYAINAGTPAYAFTVDTDNIATTIPAEFTQITVTGTVTVGIAIRRKAGARDPFMKYVVGGTPAFTIAEHNTASGAIDPDASSARGALTVAASNFATPATPEGFSSRGPAVKRFDVAGTRLAAPENRNKPDISAADGVATSVTGFATFFGTSAAAPSAAGVAALVLSAKPSLTVDELAAILKDSRHTTDCTATIGLPDADCGFGFELADGAVRAAQDATPPAVTAALDPAAPNGANGWYTTPSVSVAWTTSDPESPLTARTGCDPAPISADATTTSTCNASSIGGTATQSVAINHDASAPAAPAFSGISARSYTVAQLPAPGALGCTSSDPTSGIASCAVSGFSAAVGPHTLTATATNGAGLTATAALAYTVAAGTAGSGRVAAISALRMPKGRVKASSIVRSGMRGTLKAASAATRLKVAITLRGKVVASLTRTLKKQGSARLTIRLSRSGRAKLLAKPGALTIKVTGSAKNRATTTLTARVSTKR